MQEMIKSMASQGGQGGGGEGDWDDLCGYTFHYGWMNNRKFIKQLRKDNIDLSLLRSELGQLDKRRRKKTWKEQILHVLRSNPVQIVLCALVLIDAVIVIAEIILEIHSEKSTKEAYQEQLEDALHFLNLTFPGYMSQPEDSHSPMGESLIDQMSALLSELRQHNHSCLTEDNSFMSTPTSSKSITSLSSSFNGTLYNVHRRSPSSDPSLTSNSAQYSSWFPPWSTLSNLLSSSSLASMPSPSALSSSSRAILSSDNEAEKVDATLLLEKNEKQKMAKTLHHVSEVLHYASIAILALFVFEVFLKILCLGKAFFKEKFEVVDAVVILTSFVADIVFVYVAFNEVSVMVIVLLWRIVRVINGLMMHEKQRDEFRIQLQKRARRMSEMKVEGLEIGKEMQDKHITSLEELCRELGGTEEQIKKCKPRYMNHTSLQTNNALKSMAAMTTGFLSGLVRAQPNNLVLSRINHFAESPRTKTRPLQPIQEQPMSSKIDSGPTSPTPSSDPTLKVTVLNGKPANPGSKFMWLGGPHIEDSGVLKPQDSVTLESEIASDSERNVKSSALKQKENSLHLNKRAETLDANSNCSVVDIRMPDVDEQCATSVDHSDENLEEKKKLLPQDTISTSSSISSTSYEEDSDPWQMRLSATEKTSPDEKT